MAAAFPEASKETRAKNPKKNPPKKGKKVENHLGREHLKRPDIGSLPPEAPGGGRHGPQCQQQGHRVDRQPARCHRDRCERHEQRGLGLPT